MLDKRRIGYAVFSNKILNLYIVLRTLPWAVLTLFEITDKDLRPDKSIAVYFYGIIIINLLFSVGLIYYSSMRKKLIIIGSKIENYLLNDIDGKVRIADLSNILAIYPDKLQKAVNSLIKRRWLRNVYIENSVREGAVLILNKIKAEAPVPAYQMLHCPACHALNMIRAGFAEPCIYCSNLIFAPISPNQEQKCAFPAAGTDLTAGPLQQIAVPAPAPAPAPAINQGFSSYSDAPLKTPCYDGYPERTTDTDTLGGLHENSAEPKFEDKTGAYTMSADNTAREEPQT